MKSLIAALIAGLFVTSSFAADRSAPPAISASAPAASMADGAPSKEKGTKHAKFAKKHKTAKKAATPHAAAAH